LEDDLSGENPNVRLLDKDKAVLEGSENGTN
jgi:hypothetical protein